MGRVAGFAEGEMMDEQKPNEATAVSLMRMALGLLDKAGKTTAAAYLQHAIDVAIDAPIPRTVEEVEAHFETDDGRKLLRRYGLSA
ncbi:hypothetical protein [Sphingomonas sp.]|uniref:hypothetical protein n=1 Tax=Sphingomonas sp. TaxID=28214 RepID=UPI000DB3EAF5|nr:hypothetical protein [Sphingomonas sp.]PZU06004.1 MAG: hypothetical protein DI605_20555 [Sphingomonas sp.]